MAQQRVRNVKFVGFAIRRSFFPCQINQMKLSESKVKQPFGFSSVKKKESERIVQKNFKPSTFSKTGLITILEIVVDARQIEQMAAQKTFCKPFFALKKEKESLWNLVLSTFESSKRLSLPRLVCFCEMRF